MFLVKRADDAMVPVQLGGGNVPRLSEIKNMPLVPEKSLMMAMTHAELRFMWGRFGIGLKNVSGKTKTQIVDYLHEGWTGMMRDAVHETNAERLMLEADTQKLAFVEKDDGELAWFLVGCGQVLHENELKGLGWAPLTEDVLKPMTIAQMKEIGHELFQTHGSLDELCGYLEVPRNPTKSVLIRAMIDAWQVKRDEFLNVEQEDSEEEEQSSEEETSSGEGDQSDNEEGKVIKLRITVLDNREGVSKTYIQSSLHIDTKLSVLSLLMSVGEKMIEDTNHKKVLKYKGEWLVNHTSSLVSLGMVDNDEVKCEVFDEDSQEFKDIMLNTDDNKGNKKVKMDVLNPSKQGERFVFADLDTLHHIHRFKFFYNSSTTWGDLQKSLNIAGLRFENFRILYVDSEVVPYETISSMSSMSSGDFMVKLVPRMSGGGPSKVIKTMLKTKVTETTTTNDKGIYEQGFLKAMDLHNAHGIDMLERLKKVDVSQLKELHKFLKHDKSTSQKKAEKLHEYLDEYTTLQSLQHKVNAAMQRLKTLTIEATEDEEGKFDHKAFTEKIGNMIAVKEDNDMRL